MSVRKAFVDLLHQEMRNNEKIVFLVGDLGYGHFDKIREEFPNRVLNPGAAEQLMLGMAVGIAQDGLIPVCYSMTPFVLYRPFEVIRTYIDYEKAPVILVGAGRDKDYASAGWSHWATDDKVHMSGFTNIRKYWPADPDAMHECFEEIINSQDPCYLNLSR